MPRQNSATSASPRSAQASPSQRRERTGWCCTKRTQRATISGAVYSNSSAIPTGIRWIATK